MIGLGSGGNPNIGMMREDWDVEVLGGKKEIPSLEPLPRRGNDLRDLAEEARERKKDCYLRNEQAPVVFVPTDPTEERRGGVTSDPTGINVVEGGEEVI
ncbi:hypothetical protein KFK09_017138 [Dendrobium nobile]|uniref:Uncharacterized protein n=1 Tax=Dendrobium nobile TaxID=94219 RepID=A0A8T3B1F3_DENNO|nr:hypothetical protein KFK09_017138 [Dendrobium nobile]